MIWILLFAYAASIGILVSASDKWPLWVTRCVFITLFVVGSIALVAAFGDPAPAHRDLGKPYITD